MQCPILQRIGGPVVTVSGKIQQDHIVSGNQIIQKGFPYGTVHAQTVEQNEPFSFRSSGIGKPVGNGNSSVEDGAGLYGRILKCFNAFLTT